MPKAKPPKELHNNFEAYASKKVRSHSVVLRWISDHLELMEEVKVLLEEGYSAHLVWSWLKEEHDFPFSESVVRGVEENRY